MHGLDWRARTFIGLKSRDEKTPGGIALARWEAPDPLVPRG